MKFVLLKSRGGDYMVIAQNVAWLGLARERSNEGRNDRQRCYPRGWYY